MELNSFIENSAEDEPYSKRDDTKKASDEFMERVKGLRDRTNFYIAHQVRATHEDRVKTTLLETLKDGECIIIMDWKMKLLPTKYREGMQEYFGKAGITWHGVYLLFKKNGVYTTKFYNDIGDDKEDDGFAVLSSLIDTCKLIKRTFHTLLKVLCFQMVRLAAEAVISQ